MYRWVGDAAAGNWDRGRKEVGLMSNRKARGASREVLGDDRIRDLARGIRHMRAFSFLSTKREAVDRIAGGERRRGRQEAVYFNNVYCLMDI
jgi:hypothetical protein